MHIKTGKPGSSWPALFLILIHLAVLHPAWAENDDGEPPSEVGYFALKPSIVSNLTGGPKYIRCDIQFMTQNATQLPRIELHAPALRHTILMLIADQDGGQLQTREGKEALRKAALDATQAQLKELTGKPLVDDLYFTAYYVK